MEKIKLENILNLIKADSVDEVAEILRDEKFDPYDGSRLLCYAAQIGAINTVKILLESDGIMPDIQDNYPIRIAKKKGHDEVVKLLAADPRVDEKVLERTDEEIKKIGEQKLENFKKIKAEYDEKIKAATPVDKEEDSSDELLSMLEEKLKKDVKEFSEEDESGDDNFVPVEDEEVMSVLFKENENDSEESVEAAEMISIEEALPQLEEESEYIGYEFEPDDLDDSNVQDEEVDDVEDSDTSEAVTIPRNSKRWEPNKMEIPGFLKNKKGTE